MDFQQVAINWQASLLAVLPEILLTILAILILALDLSWPESRRRQLAFVAAAGMAAIIGVMLLIAQPVPVNNLAEIFGGMIRHDALTQIFRTMVIMAGALTCLISVDVAGVGRRGEYYALVIVATIGASLMSAASDLIMVFLGLETTTISLYMLAGFLRGDSRSSESGLKYFLFGSFTSALTLYGLSLLYGFTGHTNIYEIGRVLQAGTVDQVSVLIALVLVTIGFGFKVSAVPFHFWTPDVYEGAPTPVTAFISVASKAASFALLMRFFMAVFAGPDYDPIWVQLLAVMATVTMTLGNVVALWQRNIKRLLAYSSIAQAGYALIGVVAISANQPAGSGTASVAFYMFMYTLTNIAAFTVIILTSRATGSEQIADLAGLNRRSPGLALVMTIALLSLGGIPPAAGFFGKFFLFNAAVNANFVWLALVGVINAIVALYYYLVVIKVMYVDRGQNEDVPIPVGPSYGLALGLTTLGVIFIGVVSAPIYNWALLAGQSLF